ncbi:MAG: uroporphyrinogen decarboxylase [Alphaproteobacteria bacterium]|nr:MAG: uroporphyrinogen decarboxylase [Alphaproteobacteria bacterium]
MKTEFIKRLSGEHTDHIPVWLMRQAGRYLPEYREVRKNAGDFLTLCYTPKLASEVTLQPLQRFDLDAAIIFSDILVIPHALGQKVWFEEGEGPRLDPIQSIDDLPEFNQDKFLNHLDPVFEALRLTRAALPDDKSLIGFAGAPWTLACYMINGRGSRDYQNVRHYTFQNPDAFQNIIDRLVDVISIYLIEKIKNGANALQIFDSWCGVLSVEEFDRWSVQPTAEIVRRVRKAYPDIPMIGFPRMAGYGYEDYVEKTGINAVSCDPTLPLSTLRAMQDHVCVQGNLDNLLLLKGGDAMVSQAKKICEALNDKPFIFNLGHGVIKETPPEHVELLIKTIKDFTRG